jgi:hypothetical protein
MYVKNGRGHPHDITSTPSLHESKENLAILKVFEFHGEAEDRRERFQRRNLSPG